MKMRSMPGAAGVLSRYVELLARTLAYAGGTVLIAIIVLTCVSIFGRAFIFLGLSPVPGDYELVEAAAAFSVFLFLPWCQINRGHAAVDIFTNAFSERVNLWIDFIAELLLALALIVITWKLFDGTMSKTRNGETTFILQFPVWWSYAASLFAASLGNIVAFYMVFVRLKEAVAGKTKLTPVEGAVH